MSAASRACRARGLWRTTDTRAALHHKNIIRFLYYISMHYTAADRRPTNQESVRQAERGSRPTRTTCCGHPGEAARGCYAENGPVEFKLKRARCGTVTQVTADCIRMRDTLSTARSDLYDYIITPLQTYRTRFLPVTIDHVSISHSRGCVVSDS